MPSIISLIRADVGGYPRHSSVHLIEAGLGLFVIETAEGRKIDSELAIERLRDIEIRQSKLEGRVSEIDAWRNKLTGAFQLIMFLITVLTIAFECLKVW